MTKKALSAISSNTDDNRSKMSDLVRKGEVLTAGTFTSLQECQPFEAAVVDRDNLSMIVRVS